jgi:hypothetical protein
MTAQAMVVVTSLEVMKALPLAASIRVAETVSIVMIVEVVLSTDDSFGCP